MEQPDDASINQGKYVQANGLNIYYEEFLKIWQNFSFRTRILKHR